MTQGRAIIASRRRMCSVHDERDISSIRRYSDGLKRQRADVVFCPVLVVDVARDWRCVADNGDDRLPMYGDYIISLEHSVKFVDTLPLGHVLAAGLAISLTAAPRARAQVSVEGSTVRERIAQPGERYTGSFVVVNSSAEPQEARLYQTDYSTSADGTNSYGAPGSSPRSNATWISVSPLRLVVPPHASREVSFTVTVPADTSLIGSYWSMLMVEGVPHSSRESTLSSDASHQVQAAVVTRIRYAVQMVTHVGATPRPVAKFVAPAVHATRDGTKELQVDIVNDGIRSFAPSFTLEVYGEDGTRVTSAALTREILYPGTSLRQHFRLGALPAGSYRALVTLDAGENAVFGAQYSLKL